LRLGVGRRRLTFDLQRIGAKRAKACVNHGPIAAETVARSAARRPTGDGIGKNGAAPAELRATRPRPLNLPNRTAGQLSRSPFEGRPLQPGVARSFFACRVSRPLSARRAALRLRLAPACAGATVRGGCLATVFGGCFVLGAWRRRKRSQRAEPSWLLEARKPPARHARAGGHPVGGERAASSEARASATAVRSGSGWAPAFAGATIRHVTPPRT
jgi:hypothetical protein